MKNRIMIFLVLLSFGLTTPVMAVRKVPRDKPSREQSQPAQNPETPQKPPEPGKAVPPEPKPAPQKDVSPPPSPEHRKIKDRDRFIDEDGDGINDNLKKPPEVIKKKKETTSQKHKRGR